MSPPSRIVSEWRAAAAMVASVVVVWGMVESLPAQSAKPSAGRAVDKDKDKDAA